MLNLIYARRRTYTVRISSMVSYILLTYFLGDCSIHCFLISWPIIISAWSTAREARRWNDRVEYHITAHKVLKTRRKLDRNLFSHDISTRMWYIKMRLTNDSVNTYVHTPILRTESRRVQRREFKLFQLKSSPKPIIVSRRSYIQCYMILSCDTFQKVKKKHL